MVALQGSFMVAWRCLLLHCFLLHAIWDVGSGQIHYSVQEESKPGTFVGYIARDLGLEVKDFISRMFRIDSSDKTDYFEVNLQNGILFVNARIDREELCSNSPVCVVHLEVIGNKPVKIYHVEVKIEDVNDNSPLFPVNELNLLIAESRLPGSRFPLEVAFDADIGTNSIETYQLSPNEYFSLEMQTNNDQRRSAELVLKQSLDREHIPLHYLTLSAVDGGKPQLTGTLQLVITVQDVNDNTPTFDCPVYRIGLLENAAIGTLVVKLNATDLDEGINADVIYSFSSLVLPDVRATFNIIPNTGEITLKGTIDFEDVRFYEVLVDAIDQGHYPISGHGKVLVEVLDINDNAPALTVTSLSLPVPEDSPIGTVIALISVSDKDSGANGMVNCYVSENVPFKMISDFKNYYSLILDGSLDREIIPQYEAIITATDEGSPALSTTIIIRVEIDDVNDNAPNFSQTLYILTVKENNFPGSHIFTISALDPDLTQNGIVTYAILDNTILGLPISTYFSINPESGKIYALQSFDYENINLFKFQVNAKDAGLTPLCNNVTLNIFILDQNDNPPTVLPPYFAGDSSIIELVPRSAIVGQVIAKIRAIDADSGYNAWLSYEFKEVDNTAFRIGLHSGEICIRRHFEYLHSDRQILIVLVKDHGDPAMSATATLTISYVDSAEDVKSNSGQELKKEYYWTDLNNHLIISICSISSIFLITIILYIALKLHTNRESMSKPGVTTLVCSNTVASWTCSQQPPYNFYLSRDARKNDLMAFSPNLIQSPENEEEILKTQSGKAVSLEGVKEPIASAVAGEQLASLVETSLSPDLCAPPAQHDHTKEPALSQTDDVSAVPKLEGENPEGAEGEESGQARADPEVVGEKPETLRELLLEEVEAPVAGENIQQPEAPAAAQKEITQDPGITQTAEEKNCTGQKLWKLRQLAQQARKREGVRLGDVSPAQAGTELNRKECQAQTTIPINQHE
ncbi:protocadherin alpha-5-like [Rhinatrema bivittatum]|uniref:protocadherin alpha-5-like n=1 Tax=Rhinatrema bivittatum TaxID=194408 RepID=UPI001125CE8B|nr:protocadherin alpha-5-like [Rhinatrema bivittatum]